VDSLRVLSVFDGEEIKIKFLLKGGGKKSKI